MRAVDKLSGSVFLKANTADQKRNLLFRVQTSLVALALALAAPAIAQAPVPVAAGTLVPAMRFTLPNGLSVVFHVDRSDPVVAVTLAAHVGSGRELPGRTGLAHMFEHLFFLDSENLGPGGLDKLTTRVGGSGANGFTNRDQTVYLQTVPKDALERMLWAEADKMCCFISTVTDAVLAKEKQVVKNEKRQGVDNRPYGHEPIVLADAIYGADHPYSWQTLGSLADLDAATLKDVKEFYARWYVPNNATLVVAGDFDPVQARAWVERYFGEIPRGAAVAQPAARPAALAASKRLAHEDNFAQLPQLTIAWPTVPAHHPDEWPIVLLFDILAQGPDAPLRKLLVEEAKLTDDVQVFHQDARIAGEAYLRVRAFAGVSLDKAAAAIDAGMARFAETGVDAAALKRAKTMREAEFYGRFTTVLGKAEQLARYDDFLGRPGFADTDLARLRGVTPVDLMRVYRAYVVGKPTVMTSFVPKGQTSLALAGSVKAAIVEEKIVAGAEAEVDAAAGRPAVRTRIASRINRSVEPPAGPAPLVKPPLPWTGQLANGLTVMGIEDRELPVVAFELAIDGGRLRDDPARPGAANLLARMLMRGTARRDRQTFEAALQALGADLAAEARDERLVIRGTGLARSFAALLSLMEEALLEPRWDPAELALVKSATLAGLKADQGDAGALAVQGFASIAYGPGHPLGYDRRGTEASLAALDMVALKDFHAQFLSPDVARLRVVGAVNQAEVAAAAAGLGRRWVRRRLIPPAFNIAFKAPQATKIWFRDLPNAKQSMLLMAGPGPSRADPDYFAAAASNFLLGGGDFASRLAQQLREGKGYTNNLRAQFYGGLSGGRFQLVTPVRANVTLEAAKLARDIVRDYGGSFTPDDLVITKDSLTKSQARTFEEPRAKLAMLAQIGDNGLPADFVAREAAALDRLTLEQVRAQATRWFDVDHMIMVVVGDGATQADRLGGLGYGPVVPLASPKP